jgi:serine O-acetyltransferase
MARRLDARWAVVEAARRYRRYADRTGVLARILRALSRVRLWMWNWFAGSDVLAGARIGRNVMLPHPNGVVIHEHAIVGDDCMIMQQVTIGAIRAGEVPTLGDKVYVGAGAKILGKVTVGNGAAIGANAVVLTDVPEGWVAVGVPAVARSRKPGH